jgi:hypothetical protein
MAFEEVAGALSRAISDFRSDDGLRIDVDHVLRWAYQFDADIRERLLLVTNKVLTQTYVSRTDCINLIRRVLTDKKLTAGNPVGYWSNVYLYSEQQRGRSQLVLNALIKSVAKELFGEEFKFAGPVSNLCFYFDDFIFTGARAQEDLTRWVERVKNYDGNFRLEMGFFAVHLLGEFFLQKSIEQLGREHGRKFSINRWRFKNYENRKARRNSSSVLWPSVSAASVGFPEFDRDGAVLRIPPGDVTGLWTEEERAFLEKTLLRAGCKIAASCEVRKASLKPLGYSPFGVGFGAVCMSYLNCPNNAPLALWWTARTRGMLGGWHALLPRRTNDEQ